MVDLYKLITKRQCLLARYYTYFEVRNRDSFVVLNRRVKGLLVSIWILDQFTVRYCKSVKEMLPYGFLSFVHDQNSGSRTSLSAGFRERLEYFCCIVEKKK